MNSLLVSFSVAISSLCFATGAIAPAADINENKVPKSSNEDCKKNQCPKEGQSLICGYNFDSTSYKMFPSRCAMIEYTICHKTVYVETPIEFCIKEHNKKISSRRLYGESCPVFCPSHYRPVCGASKFKSYAYRAFNNGCYMDMLNCRGEDEDLGYVEVPLEFCQRHAMKNIFKEQLLISNMHDYRDYE